MQRFLITAYIDAETNAILHATPDVDEFHELIRQHWLKDAIRLLEDGLDGA